MSHRCCLGVPAPITKGNGSHCSMNGIRLPEFAFFASARMTTLAVGAIVPESATKWAVILPADVFASRRADGRALSRAAHRRGLCVMECHTVACRTRRTPRA